MKNLGFKTENGTDGNWAKERYAVEGKEVDGATSE